MGLEIGTYISDLVNTNPTPTDKRREGDDHLRLLKVTIKNSFPNVDGAVNPSVDEFNYSVGVTSAIQAQLDTKLVTADAPGDGLVEAGGVLAVGVGLGIVVNADDVQLEISGLTAIEGNALNTEEDGYLVNDNGVPKVMSYTDAGVVVVLDITTARILATVDCNTYLEMNNAGAIAVTVNTGFGKRGNFIILEQLGVGQITVGGTATINAANGLKTKKRYSVIVLACKGSNIWTLSGDAST